jgi:CBS domain containing-hemolysin-like protein
LEGIRKALEITNHIPLIILVFVLLGFSAFFSGSEVAYFSLQYSVVEKMRSGSRQRKMVASLLSNPRRLLVTILLGNLLVNIAVTSVVTAFAIESFGKNGVGIATIIMTVLILVFGEIAPKDFAFQHSISLAVVSAPVYRVLIFLSAPVGWILGWIADFSVRGSSFLLGEPQKGYDSLELVTAVEAGYRNGLFEDFEREILSNFFLFAETTVEEILTPRGEVFSIDVQMFLNEAVPLVKKYGFSRVPLYEETSDSIIGILLAKELLKYPSENKMRLREIMRSVWFVPESKKIRYLLNEFINAHHHVAIVVDEHGAYSGIITLEDILEEIFGEIRDRREPNVKAYQVIERGEIIVEGTFRIQGLNKILGTRIDSEEVETVAGYLTEMTGKIPREGESFNIGNIRFLVISAGETRVNKIKVSKLDKEKDED